MARNAYDSNFDIDFRTSPPSNFCVARMATTAAAMAPIEPPGAGIRPFVEASDKKVARFLVGSNVMEPSTRANQAALFCVPVIIVWIFATSLAVEFFAGGWPRAFYELFNGRGSSLDEWIIAITQLLKLSPTLAAPPLILLALFELRHRNLFEEEMTRVIGEEDMRDIPGYYQGKTEARSGFWVLEFDGRIIGALGIDGRKPGEGLNSTVNMEQKIETVPQGSVEPAVAVKQDSPYPLRNRNKAAAASAVTPTAPLPSTYSLSGTLQIRRFATSLSFRPAGIENDLLEFAANFAFAPSTPSQPLPPVNKLVIAVRPSVESDFVYRLARNGYKSAAVGNVTPQIKMDDWKAVKAAGSSALVARTSQLMELFWPLDLQWVTFVLLRSDWEKMQLKKEKK